jgi:hypothetical protein
MAIVYKYGRLSLFIMFTANPKWDEITYKLLPGQTAINRPNLVMCVFYLKLNYFIYDLKWV